MSKQFFMIHNLRDPNDPQGRSYKQVNAEKRHNISLGALVELDNGVRLFVVRLGRDCDATPLYWLSSDEEEIGREPLAEHRYAPWVGGFPEEGLKVIGAPHP